MTELSQIYKCSVCGNMVEVIHAGGGELVCCQVPMNLQEEKNEEEGFTEKHLPVLEQTAKGIKAKIGSISHPMEEAHFIEWIEIKYANNECVRKLLKPGDLPEFEFLPQEKIVLVRAYCNIHGLWSIKLTL